MLVAPYAAVISSAVQLLHAEAPPPDHVPSPHAVHTVAAPARENVPLAQGRHVRFTRERKLPALHTNWHRGEVPRPTKML